MHRLLLIINLINNSNKSKLQQIKILTIWCIHLQQLVQLIHKTKMFNKCNKQGQLIKFQEEILEQELLLLAPIISFSAITIVWSFEIAIHFRRYNKKIFNNKTKMLNHHLIIWQLSYKVSNNKNNIRIK